MGCGNEPEPDRRFFQWRDVRWLEKLSSVLWRRQREKRVRAHAMQVIAALPSSSRKPHRSLKPHTSQVVPSVSNFVGFWPESMGSGLQMCWELTRATEVNGSWALNSLLKYKVRPKEEDQNFKEVFDLVLCTIFTHTADWCAHPHILLVHGEDLIIRLFKCYKRLLSWALRKKLVGN